MENSKELNLELNLKNNEIQSPEEYINKLIQYNYNNYDQILDQKDQKKIIINLENNFLNKEEKELIQLK